MNGRLVILHQRRYDILDPSVTILGCVLWSPIPQESTDIVRSKISDFHQIKEWSVAQRKKAHDSDLTWLRDEIQTLRGTQEKRSVLVVTHHALSLQRTSSLQHAKILNIEAEKQKDWTKMSRRYQSEQQ
ncbi:unnamed protein product [Penicillium viridicatum]